ncbi:D-serine dehydratase [Streptococcus pseudoporcinus]|uniref:Probable D-serine dehydratase n=1 Tax=Streptococcus pseudoporcinus TaxID=361101 RepID=A0A4U9ZNW9_9STRE|nr:D-serine ammonia-lyase [Streptococcus pseudoporcinus]VTS42045.1 D-serine dehydratase [Streptococcus pseudoporcinus]
MSLETWKKDIPEIEKVMHYEELFWMNDSYQGVDAANKVSQFGKADIKDAEDRLKRFAPYFADNFECTRANDGIIESAISQIPEFQHFLEAQYQIKIPGQMYLKRDDTLPIAGTIKARGAIYEVLKHAETLALEAGILSGYDDDYRKFASPEFKKFFSQYKIMVGTTGNLGISVGIMGVSLGFEVVIHMSYDAKEWKKQYLRDHGVVVIEHKTNFTEAVNQGRAESDADPKSYFVDDEHSVDLFLGYTVGPCRLKKQLEEKNILVDEDHPLFVFSPCGIGGSPGGTAFGLKQIYGDNVHCFFAQPTHMPSMLVGLLTKEYSKVCVADFDIDAKTNMDGLAVPRTSGFVAELMHHYFNGGITISEEHQKLFLTKMIDLEDIHLEPAALAGTIGPAMLFGTEEGRAYLKAYHLEDKMQNATYIAWATGGSMVPKADMEEFYQEGK